MGTPTGTKVVATEFAGEKKIVVVSFVPTATSDTITISLASHGISTIDAILGVRIKTGQDADLATIFATFSSLTVTVVTLNAAGAAATDFTNATAELVLLGY